MSFRLPRLVLLTAACLALSVAGCFEDKQVIESTDGLSSSGPPPGVCKRGGSCSKLPGGSDKLDLLFMIDNSASMREEQTALLDQLPALIEALTTGDADADGNPEFGAVNDLHLGVVSSDMGLPGIDGVELCSGFGDDGLLQHVPRIAGADCKAAYPPFLSYVAPDTKATDQSRLAQDFACIATLGTDGCGFEQQLEAPLKALWPSNRPLPGAKDDDVAGFLGASASNATHGHGDVENAGFLRSDAKEGQSLIAVLVISDEDDGSSANPHHFTPPQFLPGDDPLANEPLNLRNHYHQDELYSVTRYIDGLKALRPGHEEMVVFGAITGVPPDLADAAALAAADRDAAARAEFYQTLLDDRRMKERVDGADQQVPGAGNLFPVCESSRGKAYPARRIVRTARGFAENGFVQSICDADYRLAVTELAKRIGAHVTPNCLDARHGRDSDDALIACDLRVVLPADGSLRRCSDIGPGATAAGRVPTAAGSKARVICDVGQLPGVTDAGADSGWYYDDTSTAARSCAGGGRIALSGASLADAEAYLDCDSRIGM